MQVSNQAINYNKTTEALFWEKAYWIVRSWKTDKWLCMASTWNRSVLTTLLYKAEVHQLWDKAQWSKGSVLPWCDPSCHLWEHEAVPTPAAPCGSSWQALGLSHPSCPWDTQRLQREEEEGAHIQLPKEHSRLFPAQQRAPVGGEGWQTALCVLHGPHSWKQGKRGKRPLQSQQSRLFISLFVRSFSLKRLSRFTQAKCTQGVGKLSMNTRPTGCSVQETENGINPLNWRPKHRLCPMELPSGVPSHPSVGLHSGEAVGGWLRYPPGLAPLPKTALPYARGGQLLAQA